MTSFLVLGSLIQPGSPRLLPGVTTLEQAWLITNPSGHHPQEPSVTLQAEMITPRRRYVRASVGSRICTDAHRHAGLRCQASFKQRASVSHLVIGLPLASRGQGLPSTSTCAVLKVDKGHFGCSFLSPVSETNNFVQCPWLMPTSRAQARSQQRSSNQNSIPPSYRLVELPQLRGGPRIVLHQSPLHRLAKVFLCAGATDIKHLLRLPAKPVHSIKAFVPSLKIARATPAP